MQEQQETYISGSLVLRATSRVHPLPLVDRGTSGQHVEGRYRGLWYLQYQGPLYHTDLSVPHRNHYHQVLTLGESPGAHTDICSGLESLDVDYHGARYQYKLNQLRTCIPGPFASVVNTIGDYGTIALLATEYPIYLYGVVDTVDTSVQLLWSTLEHPDRLIRQVSPVRYIFYRFPVVQDYALFLNTQALCSQWWSWEKKLLKGSSDILKIFNILELRLFKDPNLRGL